MVCSAETPDSNSRNGMTRGFATRSIRLSDSDSTGELKERKHEAWEKFQHPEDVPKRGDKHNSGGKVHSRKFEL